MQSDNLSTVLVRINAELSLPGYLQQICVVIAKGNITKGKVEDILTSHAIKNSIAKVDFLHLVFAYIKIALEDGILNIEERGDIKLLKTLFKIQLGDFHYHNKLDIEQTITLQLSKMYEDNFITAGEAELKADIQ